MRHVEFDPATATAVVEAGTGWRDVDRVTYLVTTAPDEAGVPHAYAAPGGDCPTVGNAGYSLGGGYGLLSRRYGLACDHIVEAQVVDAQGRILRAAEDENADLWWALRGAGGGSFGVVTRLRYRLDPVPTTVIGGAIGWPLDQAQAVFRGYRDRYVGRDEDRLSLYLLLTTDPYPDGEKVVVVYGLYIGSPDQADAHLAPIRSLGRPLFDSFGPTSYYDLQQGLGEEIRYGLQSKWRGGYFRDTGFDDEAFTGIIDQFQRAPSGYSMARFDLLGGGGVGRTPADATAFVHRSALFYISVISLWQHDRDTDTNLAWTDDFADTVRPYLTGEVYQNYADEDLPDWENAYYGQNYPRLRQIKGRYDPDNFFRHRQTIRLPGA